MEYSRVNSEMRKLHPQGECVMREWLDEWAIPDLDTEQEHIGAVAVAGFSNIGVRDCTIFIRPSLARLDDLVAQ